MLEQLDLINDLDWTPPPEPRGPQTLEDRFERFHAANPHVYHAIVDLARQARSKGERVAIATIFEVLRWRHVIETDEAAQEFRLNNSYRALYARLVMDQEHDLRGFFDVRDRASEKRNREDRL